MGLFFNSREYIDNKIEEFISVIGVGFKRIDNRLKALEQQPRTIIQKKTLTKQQFNVLMKGYMKERSVITRNNTITHNTITRSIDNDNANYNALTPQETRLYNVLMEAATPMTNKQMSLKMGLKTNSIRVYVNSLKRKIDLEEHKINQKEKAYSVGNSIKLKKLYNP